MKKLVLFLLMTSLVTTAEAQARKNKQPVGSSSNAASAGSSTMSGASDGPLGPNEMEKEEARERASSMGGAPNVGTGMGTGTGAGSRVGKPTGKGTLNAGAMGAEEEEMDYPTRDYPVPD